MDYLSELNPSQRQAVEATEGPVMVIAGAGSGKTRVLTYRIAHLINKGVDAFNILALTFTNKAANEMKERIAQIVGPSEARNIWMGTFHSVFARILRQEAERIGFPRDFTIYDTQDSKNLIKTIIKEYGLDDKIYKPGLVLGRISAAKNNLISVEDYKNNVNLIAEDRQSAKPKMVEIYETYQRRLFKSSAMDFDDLLFKTNVLLAKNPDILVKYQHQFKYILVDEYQDTNFSQYLIVKQLAAAYQNICVVGDDAQSIYAFRGANIQNILNFKKDYPDAKIFKLEQNYRSTKNIVKAANSIIELNKEQIKKEVWTDNEEGNKIEIYKASSDNEEGQIIANLILEQKLTNQLNNSDFAVLYRTNAQSRAIEEALRKKNIPYKIYGGTSFYQRKEIKDLLAYYRLAINPNDEESLKRVINYPARGIGKTTLDKISVAAVNSGKSMWEIIANIKSIGLGLNSGTINKIWAFAEMIKSFNFLAANTEAYELGNQIASTSGILKELYSDKTPEGISRYENVQELLNGLKEFSENQKKINPEKTPVLPDFMQDVALLTDQDTETDEDRDKVTLMTIHASKGLEFPYVFIAGMEENLFPSQMALNSRAELEEERRLFYVAVTRAKKQCYLSYATQRFKWGQQIYCEPSRFIDELNPLYVEHKYPVNRAKKALGKEPIERKSTPIQQPRNLKKVSEIQQTPQESASNLPIVVGSKVEHQKFGVGEVLELENGKASIQFKNAGKKQLLLKYAKLKLIS
jgi:DNA helicase-2/ATP-dependent DNA helicase PcrA